MKQADKKICPKCKKGKLKITDTKTYYKEQCEYCGFGIGKPQTKKGEVKKEIEQKMEFEYKRFKKRIRPVTKKHARRRKSK